MNDDDSRRVLRPGEVPLPAPVDPAAPEVVTESPSKRSGRRVPANPERPRLSARIERKLAPGDERMAAAYEQSEDATAQLLALTDALKDGAVEGELEMSDSLVQVIRTHVVGPPKVSE